MTDAQEAYRDLVIESEELAESRASFHAIRVLLPLSHKRERERLRVQLEGVISEVAGDEWPGDGTGGRPDEPRASLGANGALFVTEVDDVLSDFPRDGRTPEQRLAAAVHRYEWLKPRVASDSIHLIDFHARSLVARSRNPALLDSIIAEYEELLATALALAGGKMTFMISLFQTNLGSLLTRRGTAADFDRALDLEDQSYRWRRSVYTADHAFTLVAKGNMVSTRLARVEDRDGRRPIAHHDKVSELRAIEKDATAILKQRTALFGDVYGAVALSLSYAARVSLALGDIRTATRYAQRSIAAMPNPPASEDVLTVPMSEVVLAQCMLITLKIEDHLGKSPRPSDVDTVTRKARSLVDHALPILEKSGIAARWVLRARSLESMDIPAQVLRDVSLVYSKGARHAAHDDD